MKPYSIIVLFAAIASSVVIAQSSKTESPFNGKDLSNWTTKPAEFSKHWTVEDGMIVGDNPDKKGSMIWSVAEYENYELELNYLTKSSDYDSGVFLRGGSHQVQIGISRSLKRDLTGCIYAPKDKKGGYPAQTDKVEKVHKLGEWNHLKIRVEGKRIQTFLNGEAFVDYEGVTIPEKGRIGLQLHAGVHQKMLFKDITLIELPKNP